MKINLKVWTFRSIIGCWHLKYGESSVVTVDLALNRRLRLAWSARVVSVASLTKQRRCIFTRQSLNSSIFSLVSVYLVNFLFCFKNFRWFCSSLYYLQLYFIFTLQTSEPIKLLLLWALFNFFQNFKFFPLTFTVKSKIHSLKIFISCYFVEVENISHSSKQIIFTESNIFNSSEH